MIHPDQIQVDKLLNQLMKGTILEEIAPLPQSKTRVGKGWIVRLDNGLKAIFKERDPESASNEVMAFHMAFQLLGIDSALVCTVPRTYRGIFGVLQPFIQSALSLEGEVSDIVLKQLYDNICLQAYYDLQIIKYLFGIGDINLSGHRAWQNSAGQYQFTYVDCEYLMWKDCPYGETHLGKSDITRYVNARDPLLTSWTSKFNVTTMKRIEALQSNRVADLWLMHGYTLDKPRLELFEKRRLSLLSAYHNTLSNAGPSDNLDPDSHQEKSEIRIISALFK